ncbi:hypothetical protein [Niabella beijingensis]|uniref:hypothetical protein n=1 Tax=Niabella beijingensis TaxID=2872700 RepID=UPI001CC12378|nr:hypothetical protein [Niabella beijingensis]MBZ4189210.1 hypothetical protein [Niabella beijingensis]
MTTNEQLLKLDQFCVRRGVDYYDLRQELVDHMAEGIEEQLRVNPDLSFEDALKRMYRSFGRYGFSEIVEERYNFIRKAAKKLEFRLFKNFFSFPKILLTILLLLLVYPLLHSHKIAPHLLYICYCLLMATGSTIYYLFIRVRFRSPQKQLLSLKAVSLSSLWKVLFLLPHLYYNLAVFILKTPILALWFDLLIACCSVALLLFFFAKYIAYKAIYENARFNYPFAFKT